MQTNKLKKRLPEEDLYMVVSIGGTKYKVKTAKKFRNQTRSGPAEYFGIVVGEPFNDYRDFGKSSQWFSLDYGVFGDEWTFQQS